MKSEISEPSSFTVKLLSHLEETQTLTDSTGLINFNYHAWPTIFNQDVIFDKHGDQVHSEGGSQPPKSDESDEVTKVEPPLGGTKAAFSFIITKISNFGRICESHGPLKGHNLD